jgi:hypothetical protein
MKALQAYIAQKNKWNAMFKGEQFEIKTSEGRMRVAESLEADMSPENLTCDGELPRAQVQARYKQLRAVAEELMVLDNKLF